MTASDDGAGQATDRRAEGRRPVAPSGRSLRDIEVSFEFFPPTSTAGAERLDHCVSELAPLGPTFASVTYGAGGGSQDRTIETLTRLRDTRTLNLAGHLTTVGASRAQTTRMIDTYLEMGLRHIVALRGDQPEEITPDAGPTTPPRTRTARRRADDGAAPAAGFESARELVVEIRRRAEQAGVAVEISVAAYPEVHPKAASADDDLDCLKRKVEAGADRAITQFFYDNDAFFRFQDRCRAAGISIPIVAGIMPIGSFDKVASFAKRCGTTIPPWMPDLFVDLEHRPEIHQLVSATVAAEQCRELADHGVRHFHFYTMNRPELTAATCRVLGVRATSVDAGVAKRAAPAGTTGS